MKRMLAFAAAATVLGAGILAAQPAGAPQIIRGSVLGLGEDRVELKTREGRDVDVELSKAWSVQVTKLITAADIRAGSFIGTAEMPQADGTGRSLEVHVFPPGVKMGEGHYGWDLQEGAMMTNGTVGKVVASANGREIDVSYPAGTRHIVVPEGVPIVQIAQGDRSMVKPGVKAFLLAAPAPNGGLIANAVVVGENGRAPPM